MASPTRHSPESVEALDDSPPLVGKAAVHGTFGELLQGFREGPDGDFEHFLFTLPVEEFVSTCTVALGAGEGAPRILPADRTRALAAAGELARVLALEGIDIGVELSSNIPPGKGCASSTADIMATVVALLDAAYPDAPVAVVRALGSLVAKEIEWGDYVFSESIALCLQRTHTLVRTYPTDLRWRIVGIDEGGSVDTAAFHRRQRESRREARSYTALQDRLHAALSTSDHVATAEIATESALMNQHALPKRHLPLMRKIADATGALGITVAHTGTVVGLIFSEHQSDAGLRIRDARQRLGHAGLASQVFTVREAGR